MSGEGIDVFWGPHFESAYPWRAVLTEEFMKALRALEPKVQKWTLWVKIPRRYLITYLAALLWSRNGCWRWAARRDTMTESLGHVEMTIQLSDPMMDW